MKSSQMLAFESRRLLSSSWISVGETLITVSHAGQWNNSFELQATEGNDRLVMKAGIALIGKAESVMIAHLTVHPIGQPAHTQQITLIDDDGMPSIKLSLGGGNDQLELTPSHFDPGIFFGVYGNQGNDRMSFSRAVTSVSGDEGNDVIYGSHFAEKISGGPGNDSIYARGGDDMIAPGTGRNLVYAGDGNDLTYYDMSTLDSQRDTVDGGSGTDRILLVGHGDQSFEALIFGVKSINNEILELQDLDIG